VGKSIVALAVARLREGGFRAAEGCPGQKLPALTDIAVAVDLHEVDLGEKTAVLTVSVLAPSAMGAQACQKAALEAGQLLQADGATCVQESCEFDGLANLFCTRITAQYSGTAQADNWTQRAGFHVVLGETRLESLVRFTAHRTAGETETLSDAKWHIQLEEFFRPENMEEESPEEPFTLRMVRPYKTETFRGCVWTEQQRVTEQTGTRQIRKGVAESRSTSVYA